MWVSCRRLRVRSCGVVCDRDHALRRSVCHNCIADVSELADTDGPRVLRAMHAWALVQMHVTGDVRDALDAIMRGDAIDRAVFEQAIEAQFAALPDQAWYDGGVQESHSRLLHAAGTFGSRDACDEAVQCAMTSAVRARFYELAHAAAYNYDRDALDTQAEAEVRARFDAKWQEFRAALREPTPR